MPVKLIFLDVDGVLNDHKFNEECQSTTIKRQCVQSFNVIVKQTGAKIILSSAWRYMVHGGAMTVRGFRYLLRTHGVMGCLLSVTKPDEELATRGEQIMDAVSRYRPASWVVLDDLSPDAIALPKEHQWRHVQANGTTGLWAGDVRRAVEILEKEVV